MEDNRVLSKHMSPITIWAFAIGSSVGWGSLVVTSSSYLAQAGPVGSVLGIVIGTVVMLIIGRCYAYLIKTYPDAGGVYTYAKESFGYDQGFLAVWFLAMTYFAVLWANATSLPLFGRIFLGGIFRVGKLYTLFGYDVYIGEALLSSVAIALTALICINFKKAVNIIMIALAVIISAVILIVFAASIFGGGLANTSPSFIPDENALTQILKITFITPWAFIGFESISHASSEYDFEHSKITKILTVSIISVAVLYILVTILSVTAYPDSYGSWFEYINDLSNLSGIEALPPFYAAKTYLGDPGVFLLMLALLALVISSLIGNFFALSRLFYAMSKDHILPSSVSKLNSKNNPYNAILLVAGISLLIPLVGRTAIGWIVDVTTIGATLIYAIVAASAASTAGRSGHVTERRFGVAGVVIMILFGAYMVLQSFISVSSMSKETYFLFIAWAVLGFVFLRSILSKDREKRFGHSVIVWVALLSLVLVIAMIWMRQSMLESNNRVINNINDHYEQTDTSLSRETDRAYIEDQINKQQEGDNRTMMIAVSMFGFALIIMLTNHSYLNKRSRENEHIANTDPMTGVKNKHAFITKEKNMNENLAGDPNMTFAVVVCDVNGLKKINDTLGHQAGDEYIKSACKMICDIFEHSPVFRIGGDEFTAILTGTDYDNRNLLMQVLHDLSVKHISSGGAVVSGGCAIYDPSTDKNFHNVFERADSLMYEEKKNLKSLGAVTRDDESDKEETAVTDRDDGLALLQIRKHILIVDDEFVNQALLGNALEDSYDILFASDGIEAIEKLQEFSSEIALVLLDLKMPKMDGLEVLHIMKEEPAFKEIPVIVLTSDHKAEVECLKAGAIDFIPKPYPEWEVVMARVNKCIELTEDRNIIQSTERDSLTKLFNVEYFNSYVKIYDQHNEEQMTDAIVIDVNRFHIINERYGKPYGDDVLRRIGERIRQIARKIDGLGCHREADTFLLYCPHTDDLPALLEKISKDISGDDSTKDIVRLRMGVYSNVDKTLDVDRRFDRAKMAADSVKNNYNNNIGIYDDQLHKAALYNERLVEDFRSSIEERHFLVYYQPKFDITGDKPVLASAEALVRWDHPELGMINPGIFIPLLEENGLILELDKYVWNTTAAQIREWKELFGKSVPVSVNVSRIDMLMPNLKEIFSEILSSHDLTVNDIILEITESAYTGDSEQVISMARELRGMSMGFRIEMDDFGTGYSSLGMISTLPIDALKLDMTFVRNAFGQKKDIKMIELIIDIANYLQVPVVAEGVETEEQYLGLKELGCDIVQGYYFSKPVPNSDFVKILTKDTSE